MGDPKVTPVESDLIDRTCWAKDRTYGLKSRKGWGVVKAVFDHADHGRMVEVALEGRGTFYFRRHEVRVNRATNQKALRSTQRPEEVSVKPTGNKRLQRRGM